MQPVYIIGHRQPDTDSIASAVAYASLLCQIHAGQYIPARCGDLNAETQYALEVAGLDAPVLIENVEPSVGDIPFLYTQTAPMNIPAIDVALLMDEYDIRNIPIVDNENRFLGLVSEHGLARAYVSPHASLPLKVGPISLKALARILQAEIINAAHEEIHGNASIVIDALHISLARLGPQDVAIIGDNEPSQIALVAEGICALIIAEGAHLGERVRESAKKMGVTLLTTPLDAFSVGRLLHLSGPVETIMATDAETLHRDDLVTTAAQIVSNSPYRTACVTDEDGHFIGMLSRNSFLEDVHKSVILVDHNEYAQAVEGIETAEILEIIDHHRLGTIATLQPIRFRNEPVGSTSTIITMRYREEQVIPDKAIATILLAGILSDTLVLKMSTTTDRDREAVAYLAEIAGIKPEEFGSELINKGMNLDGVPIEELIVRDIKDFTLHDRSVSIAQIMTGSRDFAESNAREIQEALTGYQTSHGYDISIVLVTDVIGQRSFLFASGDHGLISKLGYLHQPVILEGVMSRKKDFFPMFGQRFRQVIQI
ncbi:MAG TPA: putative manganese-dependent inorganic diphosphatase [Methanospirillum sp.]|uniref:putative manganese-dependent inorganic diphosphatase n=1 Tax=Methanospirillum sp. TaxID=45200 RepID=UPI002CC72905|nr:putative manganese-dependent inorganic diphosphatase [Methanospirillum sp.]HOJ95927.1 putative manganese-dependent inorganic diphosphatase [Methanospirillum sp.]HOL41048.1 putative manganese-dependent inorganic diphosphatase [Methanospirillum sp.]HPP77613.1 putative manganese-dependent inorganic diphosphatase [Methanospirillum sp.]